MSFQNGSKMWREGAWPVLILFVSIGNYMIWGRFLHNAWLKARTHYAITNLRVIAVQHGWRRRVASAYLDRLPAVNLESGRGAHGTLSSVNLRNPC